MIGKVLASVAIASVTCGLLSLSHPSGIQTRAIRPQPAAPGAPDNPDARERFDEMRFRDPATGRIPDNIRQKELAFAHTLNAPMATSPAEARVTAISHDWIQRGPANVGGRTRALAVDISSNYILLAGGVTGGMWRTTDGGGSWKRTTSRAQSPSVTCIAQDPRAGRRRTWYYGTGEFRTNVQRFGGALYYGNGICKSTDGGQSWNHLESTTATTANNPIEPFNYVWRIAVDPSNATNDVVYAAVYGGIMRSTNGGTTWTMTLGAGNTSGFTDVAVTSTGIVYAALSSDGATHGVWRSVNGVNWTSIAPANFPDSIRGIVLKVAPSDETQVYVLAETPGFGQRENSFFVQFEYYSLWHYKFLTGNGSGANGQWEDRSLNIPDQNSSSPYNGLMSYALVLEVAPTNPVLVYIGGSNLYRSSDGFKTASGTWLGGYHSDGSWGSPTDLHPDQHAFVFSRTNAAQVFVGCDGGVYGCTDITAAIPAWTPLSNGYVTGQFYSSAIDHATTGSVTVMGGLQDNGTVGTDSIALAAPWSTMGSGDGCYSAIADQAKAYITSSQYAMIYGTFDQGNGNYQSQQLYDDSWYNDYGKYMFVNPLALDPASSKIMYVPFGPQLWRNTNIFDPSAYAKWTALINSTTPDASWITAIGISKQPAHRLYYGTNSGMVRGLQSADKADNPGANLTGRQFPKNGYVNCIAVDPFNADQAMVVFSNYNVQSLFFTDDGGLTWTAVGGNLEQHPDGTGNGPSCRWANVLHRGVDTIWFVGTSIGLYSTTHLAGMNTVWVQEGPTTIGDAVVSMIDSRQSDGFVSVGTWGDGMYTATIPIDPHVAVNEPATTPNVATLQQSYPNPTHDHATLPLALAQAASVAVTVVAEDGREVARVMERELPAGSHAIEFDARALPSGAYWWRLRTGNNVQMMPLVKGM